MFQKTFERYIGAGFRIRQMLCAPETVFPDCRAGHNDRYDPQLLEPGQIFIADKTKMLQDKSQVVDWNFFIDLFQHRQVLVKRRCVMRDGIHTEAGFRRCEDEVIQ